jgi:aryl-phospho-beta-D-glucosidase BglC (GH1 family)
MYVMLNSHDSPNANAFKQDSVNAMQKAIWQQIATTMRDFDEHLIFAGLNEPPAEDAQQMAILNGITKHSSRRFALPEAGTVTACWLCRGLPLTKIKLIL